LRDDALWTGTQTLAGCSDEGSLGANLSMTVPPREVTDSYLEQMGIRLDIVL
jgi:hypothetical protein